MDYELPELKTREGDPDWLAELLAGVPETEEASDPEPTPARKQPSAQRQTAAPRKTSAPKKGQTPARRHPMGARRKRRIAFFWVFILLLLAGAAALFLLNGWKTSAAGTRYLQWGRPLAGHWTLNEVPYCFDENGLLREGWFEEDGALRYQTRAEGIFTGTHLIDGVECSFTETGAFCSGIFERGGVRYLRDENGLAPSGMVQFAGNRYLIGADGIVLTGWQEYEGHFCYLDPTSAQLRTGLLSTPTGTFYLDENGFRVTGFLAQNGSRYWFDETGRMAHGLTVIGEDTYFFDENGVMQTGEIGSGAELRRFADDGKMITGLLTLGSETYYINPETGYAEVRLRKDGDALYLLDENGAPQKDCWSAFGGAQHYFGADGKMLTGWQTVEGIRHYFYEDGAMAVNTSVDYYDIDASGNVSDPYLVATLENLEDYLHAILARNGSTIQDIFYYVRDNYSYHRKDQATEDEMCVRFINTGTGACWDYAALTRRLLTAAGYNAQTITGWAIDGSRHMWVLVETEKGWRHVDPRYENFEVCLLTDSEMLANDILNYGWDQSKYPACR